MNSNDYALRVLVQPLQTTEVNSRKQFLEALENFELEKGNIRILNRGLDNNNGPSYEIKEATSFYLVILRLSKECPFKDVRASCENILTKLKNDNINPVSRELVGPSRFIPQNECVSIDVGDLSIQRLFIDAFCMNGRTSHINQLLAYHVEYLECFLKFESYLLQHNGPLPLDWRYFIGIMGCSRHECESLIEICRIMFLVHGGDLEWLKGCQKIPKKLQKLNKMNRILAHQPWLLTVDMVEELSTGENIEVWSISELIQAMLILLHFQTLSGFVYGCGVAPEIDLCGSILQLNSVISTDDNELFSDKLLKTKSVCKFDTGTTAELYQKMQQISTESDGHVDEVSEKLRQFKEVEIKEADDDDIGGAESENPQLDSFTKYTDGINFHYEEFTKRKKADIDVFRAQDYNWQEHCYSFINRLYPDVGTLLDKKFDCAFYMTYNTMGDAFKNVDTSKFRVATWNYIHLVYGIFHDDYQYMEVNKLLEKSYKSYIKKVACYPERVKFCDYWECYRDMLPSEKVHINLLVLESRLMASLLYGSRCLMEYMAIH